MIPLRDDNPTRITPYVNWLLVGINVVAYLLEVSSGMHSGQYGLVGGLAGYTMVPYEVTHGVDVVTNGPTPLHPYWLTIFTAMFLHGGLLHLGGNMLFLLIFGNNIEDALGHVKYLVFYLLCGFIAAATQIAFGPDSMIPTLGASGAIAGVLGGYILLFPRAQVDTLVFLFVFITRIRLPAWLLLGFWIVSQFFSQFMGATAARGTDAQGGVAYMAHIGGFLAGLLLIKLFRPDPSVRPPGPPAYNYDYGRAYQPPSPYPPNQRPYS